MRPRVALAAITLAGCGLYPDSGLVIPPGDGVRDFGPSEPIEICIGTARLVARATDAQANAVCVLEGQPEVACSSDLDCDGIERCVCGRCIVEPCAGASACSDGQVCRDKRCTTPCSSDAECDANERCNAGGCARACANDGECHHGERCDPLDSVCATRLCGDGASCGAGQSCSTVGVRGEPHEPAFASWPEGDFAFFEIDTPGGSPVRSLWRARIEAPTKWVADPVEPVLNDASAPSVITGGGSIELFFVIGDGEGIGRATSSDGGRTFTTDPAPVLVPQASWEMGFVGSPSVIAAGGDRVLFYEGGPRRGIGAAQLAGGIATRLPSSPLLVPESAEDPVFWSAVHEIGAPWAMVEDGVVRLYFTARGVEGSDALVQGEPTPAGENDSIGLATSNDVDLRFKIAPGGPVLARITNLRAYLGEREAAVRRTPNGFEIVFVAADASGSGVVGLAHAGR